MLLDVAISGGRIAAVLAPGSKAEAKDVIDAAGKHVFPGLIDCHVHYGFGEKITEYSTETAYAAQGGFSTILALLAQHRVVRRGLRRASSATRSERSHVDFGFHLSMANEVHLQELPRYVSEFGIGSFKYYMNFKGEEGRYMGLDGTDDGYLYELLEAAAKLERRRRRLPHREHRDRQPHPAQASSRKAATRCATGACRSRRSRRPRT